MIPSFITLLIILVAVGLILWLLPKLPIDAAIQQIIRGLLIFAVVIYVILFVLDITGIYHNPVRLR